MNEGGGGVKWRINVGGKELPSARFTLSNLLHNNVESFLLLQIMMLKVL